MGNSVFGGDLHTYYAEVSIHKFYSSSSWIDGGSEQQLEQISNRAGVLKVAAFPDLHQGKYGPVGCAILADRVYPEIIGNDIGCGMALFTLDIPARKLRLKKAVKQLQKFGEIHGDMDGFGTLGGGNHFCEILSLEAADIDLGLDMSKVYLLVHTGSRGLGQAIFTRSIAELKDGCFSQRDQVETYMHDHDLAVKWARENRHAVAQATASFLKTKAVLIADVPHNLVEKTADGWLHRKGAARADGLVPVAGSRDSHSYLVRPKGHSDALTSLAHGAGRRFNRSQMRERIKTTSSLKAQDRNRFGGHVICDDRNAKAEESGVAYKSIEGVIEDLKTFEVADMVAKFKPLITFKNAKQTGEIKW